MLTFVDLYFIINIKANYVYLQWFADFMLTNLWRKKMDNYNNNGYNNDSWNNPQGNGPDPQQNNYSNRVTSSLTVQTIIRVTSSLTVQIIIRVISSSHMVQMIISSHTVHSLITVTTIRITISSSILTTISIL